MPLDPIAQVALREPIALLDVGDQRRGVVQILGPSMALKDDFNREVPLRCFGHDRAT
jgi:hypothetical protein